MLPPFIACSIEAEQVRLGSEANLSLYLNASREGALTISRGNLFHKCILFIKNEYLKMFNLACMHSMDKVCDLVELDWLNE